MSKNSKQFKLLPKSELRFKLKAESEKVTLEVVGKVYASINRETRMERYLYCHTAMDALKDHAQETETRGPVCMIAGSPGVGKTTLLVTTLADVCLRRLEADRKTKVSGTIINTCGLSLTLTLMHVAQAFKMDAIVVLGEGGIYHQLKKEMPEEVKVIHLPDVNGDAEDRDELQKYKIKSRVVKQYFNGIPRKMLYPYRLTKMKAEDCTKLFEVDPRSNLHYHLRFHRHTGY
ncbi:hypothetical protein TSAR_006164 [Trichomalopsis sarcophagae]|uniref:Clp1 P-loop domain-containing protein n=1 Tax=Trichomalopsis sarcophagae TaxID=543379 RepID=A0A232ETW2_9HYME|nr:hypothetical protein TSAR_006164 [Trichomalopsis sarcophagae]